MTRRVAAGDAYSDDIISTVSSHESGVARGSIVYCIPHSRIENVRGSWAAA